MGDSRALPGFGQVDLDLDDEVSGKESVRSDEPVSEPGAPPDSTARTSGPPKRGPPKTWDSRPLELQERDAEDAATRIVKGDALSAFTRSSPPPARPPLPPPRVPQRPPESQRRLTPRPKQTPQTTRMASVDQDLMAVARGDDMRSAGSESGIATRDARVAAMRELYARGEADAALALGEAIRTQAPPPLELEEVHDDDPYGGLIPVEEGTVQIASALELPPTEGVDVVCSMLSLTQRQSIPRVTKSSHEIAKLPIDPRGGFLLGQIDGMQTLEEILDVCAMPSAEALELIEQLRALGVIIFD